MTEAERIEHLERALRVILDPGVLLYQIKEIATIALEGRPLPNYPNLKGTASERD